MKEKVIFFVPVQEKYIARWEYYQVDYEILTMIYSKVVVCASIWQVIKNLRRTRLIYCWWWHRSAPVVLLARLLGVKTQVTGAVHMFDLSGASDFYSKPFLYRLTTRMTMYLADRNLFISRDQYLQITSHIKVNNPVIVLSSLANNACFSKEVMLRRKTDRYNNRQGYGKKFFLTVVWHTVEQYRRKGVFETLEAFAMLKKRTSMDFVWVIAGGSGDGLSALRSYIIELSLEKNVEVRVDISQDEKRELYLSSDLYIQPSWHEGFGNAVLEATSNGLPALVSKYTAQPEVVGVFGFITMEMKPENICEKLEEFLALGDEACFELEKNVIGFVGNHFTFEKRLGVLVNVTLEMGLSHLIKKQFLLDNPHCKKGVYTT